MVDHNRRSFMKLAIAASGVACCSPVIVNSKPFSAKKEKYEAIRLAWEKNYTESPDCYINSLGENINIQKTVKENFKRGQTLSVSGLCLSKLESALIIQR